ncbi:hypothetical protein J2Z50_006425 [Ensifer mexicanus]|nr:hypothetical protein [Sinorhizobium mexicanum]
MLSMSDSAKCDVQCVFAEDVLGQIAAITLVTRRSTAIFAPNMMDRSKGTS